MMEHDGTINGVPVIASLHISGVRSPQEERDTIFRIVAAVLHLGPDRCHKPCWSHWSMKKSPTSVIGFFPIGSMYGIYGNIYHQYTPNVIIYSIHGSYGFGIIEQDRTVAQERHVEWSQNPSPPVVFRIVGDVWFSSFRCECWDTAPSSTKS